MPLPQPQPTFLVLDAGAATNASRNHACLPITIHTYPSILARLAFILTYINMQSYMTIKKDAGRGFTLIELLVVIATLATVSVPFIQTAQVKARMVRSGSDARNVLMALTSYSAE